MNKIKTYLKELAIVTIGVLIALIISDLKENYQAKRYQLASIETVKIEVEANYSNLKEIIEKQTNLLDTITKYSEDNISIIDLFHKTGGLQAPTLSNAGLEFYTKNQINLIDFEMMSTLIRMNYLTELIDTKIEKLMDFTLAKVYVDSKKSKMMVIMHLQNTIESEKQLMFVYKNFIDE